MPPKKTTSTKKKTEAAEPVSTTVVVTPQPVAPPQVIVKETIKEKPVKETKVIEVKTTTPAQKTEVIKEIEKIEEEEEENSKKPSKFKKCMKVLIKAFFIAVGVLMIIIGAIGYVQMFMGATWQLMVDNPNRLISRILTNLCLFGLVLFSGVCNIPFISKEFGFTKPIFGFSIFLIFLGFSIQAGNLDNMPTPTTSSTTGGQTTTVSAGGLTNAEPEKTLNLAFGWVRGISGLILLIVGIVGSIMGCFKNYDDEDEEEEEQIIVTTK